MKRTFKFLDKINTLEIIYIVSMAFAFISRLGNYEISYKLSIIVSGFWIVASFIKWWSNQKREIQINGEYTVFFKIPIFFLIPAIIIYIYSIFLCMIGKMSFHDLSTNITAYAPALCVISSSYFFKNKIFKLTIQSMLLSFLLVSLFNVSVYGLEIFTQTFMNILFDNKMSLPNAFEVHDLTFAAGIVVLILILGFKEKGYIFILFSFVFIVFIGWKRIQIISILVVLAMYFLIRNFKINKRFINVISLFAILLFLLYVFLIDSGWLMRIVEFFGINSMGRMYYYEVISEFFDFSIFELGIGRNMVTTILSSPNYAYLNVGGVHSDILKYFAENGFVIFVLWVFYFFNIFPRCLLNQYGSNVVKKFYIITMYVFILYLTDNVDIYFCTQFTYILSITYIIKSSKLKKRIVHEK